MSSSKIRRLLLGFAGALLLSCSGGRALPRGAPSAPSAPASEFAIANVAISTPDPERLARWYSETLGFHVVERRNGVPGVELTMIERNGVVLDLIRVPNQRPLSAAMDPPDHLQVPGIRNLVFWVDDLKRMDAHLKARGVRLVWESRYIEGIGTSNTAFHDPDGNLVALWQRPNAPARGLASMKVFNTAIAVADVDATVDWYRRVLGFREVSRTSLANGASFAMAERNGVVLEFLHVEGQEAVRGLDADPPQHIKLLGVKNVCWWVDDTAATLAELDKAGVDYVWRAASARGRCRRHDAPRQQSKPDHDVGTARPCLGARRAPVRSRADGTCKSDPAWLALPRMSRGRARSDRVWSVGCVQDGRESSRRVSPEVHHV